jgi:HAD superfamily hydrolase (TIGR01509 family)
MLSEERGFPRALHSFINELKQQYTMDLVHTKCKPRFVHEYALSQLKRDGYKLAVASNSIRNTVRSMMEYSSLLPYLEFFLSNQDVAVAKPDPEIYLKAIANLNVSPDECLVLEDNENGRKAAKSSGAWLMEIGAIEEVNYLNIKTFIERINQGAVGQ